MKKCPQCGNDIPLSNKTCNYCGYSSESINKSYAYGKSNNDNNGKSNIGKIILIVFLCMLFGPFLFILPIMFFIFFSVNTVNNVVDKLPDYQDEPCLYICNDGYEEIDNYCHCNNGDIYDKGGNLQNNQIYDSSNIHLSPLDISEWKNDISLNEPVVTVLCESNDYSCEAYITVIYDSALKNGYKLYIFDVDQLNSEDRDYLLNRDVLTSFNGLYPFTFVVKGNQILKSRSGIMYEYSLETFLESAGVIGEYY